MIPLAGALAAVFCGIGVVAWYLQRRPPRRVALSFARLLPDPPETQESVSRFSWSPPWRMLAFWLHLGLVLLALAAIWADWQYRRAETGGRLGLRVVLDLSHSMSLPQGGGTRVDEARSVIADHRIAAREAARTAAHCEEILLVGQQVTRADDDASLAAARPRAEGADVTDLLAAAGQPDAGCPATHVLVVSDLPEPAIDWPEDGPRLLWRQVGAPLPNAAITDVRNRPPRLDGRPGELTITVRVFGEQAPSALILEGPQGMRTLPLESAIDRGDTYFARVESPDAGAHAALLEGGGAYSGDDRVIFDLDAQGQVALDWRLADWPPPPRVRQSAVEGTLVLPLDAAEFVPADRSVLLVYHGWEGRPRAGRIGPFRQDADILGVLNLDVLERFMPRAPSGDLPEGFVPVLTDAGGGVMLARRAVPPGVMVPAPVRSADPDLSALSLTLFFSALQSVTGRAEHPVAVTWQPQDGPAIPDAWKESDTARPLVSAGLAYFDTRADIMRDEPVWPLLALVALALMAAERGCVIVRSLLRRRRHVL